MFKPNSAGGGSFGVSEAPLQLNKLKCVMLTIPIYLFTNKILRKNEYFWRGAPLLTPLIVKPPKNVPHDCITLIFSCRILFNYKNGSVCKEVDINIFKYD